MNRSIIVNICKHTYFGGLTEAEISSVLLNYCMEHNKTYYHSALFITYLMSTGNLHGFPFFYALEYYEKKFNINKLYSKPDESGKNKIIYIN